MDVEGRVHNAINQSSINHQSSIIYQLGGVLCGALDAEGGVHDATPDLWRNCQLAAFLRSELYDPELTMHSEVLHRCV